MEELNSTTNRKLTPAQNMIKLEKACYASDARLRIRLDHQARSRLALGLLLVIPYGTYMLYNTYSPHGVWMNFRATNGAYMYWL